MNRAALAIVLATFGAGSAISGPAFAYSLNTLHSLCAKDGCVDGASPWGQLTRDESRNFFGVTQEGGKYGKGAVFELQYDPAHSTWKYKRLYSFCNPTDCKVEYPRAGLIIDSAGNLYGTASAGDGVTGVAYELLRKNAGVWQLKLLHVFGAKHEGYTPLAAFTYAGADSGVSYDGASPLYATMAAGGKYGRGTIYSLTPAAGKKRWDATVLYSFGAQAGDGQYPTGTLTLDDSGNLYGVTIAGGNPKRGGGIAYMLSGSSLTILHTFCSEEFCTDGMWPLAGLIRDPQGNLFGTTSQGGVTQCIGYTGCGVVFRLAPSGARSHGHALYDYSVLHTFCEDDPANCPDGAFPQSRLAMDASGNLFGTTELGGKPCGGYGAAFELTNGSEQVLYNFCSAGGQSCTDGVSPGDFIMDGSGNLFGWTYGGGEHGSGTIYELTP